VHYLLQRDAPDGQVAPVNAVPQLQEQVPRGVHPQMVQHKQQVQLPPVPDVLLPVIKLNIRFMEEKKDFKEVKVKVSGALKEHTETLDR
jgi:hypothetical protein